MTYTDLSARSRAGEEHVDGSRERVFVTVGQLLALRDATPVDLLDVRWELGRADGHDRYSTGHLPGAVYVDLDTELADPPSPERGRHPLPSAERLQAAVRRWGIRAERADDAPGTARHHPVVVYDAGGGLAAARAWWLLRWAGHTDVRVLDGGLAAWDQYHVERRARLLASPRTDASLRRALSDPGSPFSRGLETVDVRPEPGAFAVGAGRTPVLDADGAAELARTGILLDARAGERYRGENEPIDPRAGHIPGAVSAPTGANLGPEGGLLPDEDLRARFARLGVAVPARDEQVLVAAAAGPLAEAEPDTAPAVGVYCGSGVTASHEIAVLASIGVDAALYPGSWSQWSADRKRPVEVGG